MPSSINLLRLLAAFALTLAGAGPASAYVFILNPNTGIPNKWDPPTVPLRMMLGDATNLQDGSSFNTSARTAAEGWNTRMGAVQFTVEFATGNAAQRNRLNELWFSSTVFGDAFEGTTIAVTTSFVQGGSANRRTESDVTFRSDRTWNSYRGPTQSGVLDLQRVAYHELGHVLGLGHPDENNQSVSAIMNSRVSGIDAPTADDTEGIQKLYGPPGVPPNDNFANAVTISLGTASSVSAVGHNTNATKEGGEPNHASNAGGSSVWWRWTAPAAGSVTLDTRGSVYDTTLGVYTGSAVSALTLVASDDDIQDAVVQASEVTFNATAGTTYQIAVDGFDRDVGGITLNLAFQGATGNPPVITTQPASVTVTAGSSATFSVTATGSGTLTFQWFFNNNAIAGATNFVHVVNNAQTFNAGNYHCVVTNAVGSVTSNTATLTVNAAPPPPSSGGGGGGGAPSAWFLAALLLVGAARLLFTRRA